MQRPYRITLSALLLAGALFAVTAGRGAEQAKTVIFPPTIAYTLEKNKITLPADLAGTANLLVLSYSPTQQKDSESWLAAAKSVASERKEFRFYMLPIFPRQNILYRLWMSYSMRSESPTNENWPWTIPLFVNKEHFDRDLDIHSEDEVAVLLVDRAGKVLWRTSGAISDEKKTALLAELSPTAH